MDGETILSVCATALSVVTFIMSMLIIAMISACFLGRNIKINRKVVFAACGIILLQIVFSILNLLYSKSFEDYISSLLSPYVEDPESLEVLPAIADLIITFAVNVVSFIYAFVFYLTAYKERRFLRALEATVCLYFYYYYLQSIVEMSIVYLSGGDLVKVANIMDPAYNMFLYTVVIVDLIITGLLCCFLYFGYYKKNRFYVIRVRNRVLFIIWMIVFSFLSQIPFYGGEDVDLRYQILSFIFGLFVPLLGGFAPFLLVMTAVEKSLKDKTEYQDNYLKAQLEYIEQYKRKQEETRAFRHDIINNLSLASMMLDEDRVDDADAHIKDLLGNIKALSPEFVTGDEMLDLIVSMKADRMNELGIRFTCDGVIDGGLAMKPTDMCSVFANALDNAIEASQKSEDPFVALDIKRTSKFFVIKISNSVQSKVDVNKLLATTGYTSKKDSEHHGFGFRNIETTVEKYNGILKASSDDNVFELSVMMSR